MLYCNLTASSSIFFNFAWKKVHAIENCVWCIVLLLLNSIFPSLHFFFLRSLLIVKFVTIMEWKYKKMQLCVDLRAPPFSEAIQLSHGVRKLHNLRFFSNTFLLFFFECIPLLPRTQLIRVHFHMCVHVLCILFCFIRKRQCSVLFSESAMNSQLLNHTTTTIKKVTRHSTLMIVELLMIDLRSSASNAFLYMHNKHWTKLWVRHKIFTFYFT